MHIPDGYLSPSTCAALYAASGPFWYVALKRVKAALNSRTVPLLAVFAAFSFVIMMFNLPLPGGTTGHAVGMGMAAIILGPAVSIIAISMALLIQALFFGDGGITAFGANCFNMAIVGSIAAYVVYRLVAWRAEMTSVRRVVAAGLAGYVAINAAALVAAIEFGVQPLWFHDATGAPLYAPYPLAISIPAMMIGHLTFAGLAEFVISAGVVSYLQRTNAALLRLTAPDAPDAETVAEVEEKKAGRALWVLLGLMLLATPLGILAVGSAWGEWKPADFRDAAMRMHIEKTSRDSNLPAHVPQGLERFGAIWKAPLKEYAPSFVRNASVGYFTSASIGVGLIFGLALAGRAYLSRKARKRGAFIENTICGMVEAVQKALFAENAAHLNGVLQMLDPRVKLAGIGALIVAAVAAKQLAVLGGLFGVAVLLALSSRVSLADSLLRVWLAVLIFTGTIAAPAIFLTHGTALVRVPFLDWPVTEQGLRGAAFLVLRAETSATLATLLMLCTPWNELLRALRLFRIPVSAVVIVMMTYRYIFVFVENAKGIFEARRTRLVGRLQPDVQRRLAAASAGALLDKTIQLSAEVHTAMLARGFRGEVKLLDDLRMKNRDWWQLAGMAGTAVAAVWLGR